MSLTSRLRSLEHALGSCPNCGAVAADQQAEYERLRKLPPAELERLHREMIGEPDPERVAELAKLPPDELLRLYRATLHQPTLTTCLSCGAA